MKAEKMRVFGVFHTDGAGYSTGNAVAWYPIKAAASADPQYKEMLGYGNISVQDAIRLGDEIYVYDAEITDSKKFIGNIPLYIATDVYKDETHNSPTNTKYIQGDKNLLCSINEKKGNSTISKKIVLRDDQCYYVLRYKDPITLTNFTLSREMAVQNALDKLTVEEKQLLGLS